MVIYLPNKADAEWLIARKVFGIDGESTYTGPYERRAKVTGCFNCHSLDGYISKQCKSDLVCINCAETSHSPQEIIRLTGPNIHHTTNLITLLETLVTLHIREG